MPHSKFLKCSIVLALLMAITPANAALVISNEATQNVTCTNGVCKATALKAILNVSDLTDLLASMDVRIASRRFARDIVIDTDLSWSSASSLTLDAYRFIKVKGSIADEGPGALTLITKDGGENGALLFGKNGNITFGNTPNKLTIDNRQFILVSDIISLAADIAAQPNQAYALANSYDASVDGVYAASPIMPQFTGLFEGLGNTISNLSIKNMTGNPNVGLFATTSGNGAMENLTLRNANIVSRQRGGMVGAVVGSAGGFSFRNLHVTGSIAGGQSSKTGGLIGSALNSLIENCAADAVVTGKGRSRVGGLAGFYSNGGIKTRKIIASYSSGAVIGGAKSEAGGLVGNNQGHISRSYSIASVFGGVFSDVGGLIGKNEYDDSIHQFYVTASYAANTVSGENDSFTGGFVGDDTTFESIRGDYWDTTVSGLDHGAGNVDENGMIGLTTTEFQSGLPAGFDPKIWAQNAKINNGYPYLIDNPPSK